MLPSIGADVPVKRVPRADHDGAAVEERLLSRKKVDGVYRYSTKKSVSAVISDVISDFVHGVLGGSIAPLAAYLTQERKLDPAEIEELKQMVDKLATKSDSSSKGKQS